MPDTPKIPKELIIHNDKRIDNYYWMKERDSKPVLAYLKSENGRAKRALKPTEGLQKRLIKEMRSRIKEDEASVPVPRPPYFYSYKFVKGGEYPVYVRRKNSAQGKEESLVDGNRLGKGKEYFLVGAIEESPSQELLGYAVDSQGRRFFDLHFKDLKTGKLLPDRIENTTGNFVWANDNKTIFYVKQHPDTLRSYQLYRYVLGSNHSELLFEEKDDTYNLSLEKGRSERWIFMTAGKRDSSEVRYLDANQPSGKWELFYPRQPDFEYMLEDGGDEFYILTNWKAPNYRIMTAPAHATPKEQWREVIAHENDVFIDNMDVYKTHFLILDRYNGLGRIRVVDRKSGKSRTLDFPDPTYIVDLFGLPEYDSSKFRFIYNSLNRPTTTYEEDFITQKRKVLKARVVPGFDRRRYETRRLWATANDGTKIPLSVLMKKGLKLDGQNPVFLEGYGSYGISNDPEFHRDVFSLVDRGFIYVIAHIRGGGEMGRQWYDGGRLDKKKNTFTDFIAASEFLIQNKYTSREHLYIYGGSAGGLLVGAVLNMRPDLFHGAVAAVPFVDVVTTMLDDSVPLTTGEYREWGDPRKKEDYFYMKSYSPYDNVERKAYPNLLVTTGYHDSQVQYFEPAKWVAKLRDFKTDRNLLLLYTDMGAGHSGSAGRFESLKTTALEYAFYLLLEGIKK